MKTTYIAQAFSYEVKKGKTGKKLLPESPLQFKTAEEATNRARRMAETKAGAVALGHQTRLHFASFNTLALYKGLATWQSLV